MKIVSEKRLVVGTVSTLVGRYSLLNLEPWKTDMPWYFQKNGALSFQVVDDEGFENRIFINGDYVVTPSKVPTMIEVKRVLAEEEAHLVTIPAELPVE